ncbi:MAG: glyoxalase [Sneathiella sp.]|uniref:VOC family protein n=1 Tax=Sneathiella sp. TaxID=1964365 RepID=UPI000C4DFEC8|nr:VOC family protein [Sneathiella sp.]MAZ03559.1 glyoxalase [Sneathiella sp.]
MEQRLSLITLGVRDLARSTAFFESLGWKRSVKDAPGVSFFQCGSIAFGLFPRDELAKDAGVTADGSGFEGFSIAYNARSKAEVDDVLSEVQSLGAEIVKPAEDVFWGGYSGYFRDFDGHLWEVSWNAGFEVDSSGAVMLPD